MDPVDSRQREECRQFRPIFFEFIDRLRKLFVKLFGEPFPADYCVRKRGRFHNVVELAFGDRLDPLRKIVQDVCDLMNPAPLFARRLKPVGRPQRTLEAVSPRFRRHR